jgi:ornithine cyclodeaminase/alanine dehydrogenase-like protein (mu-crystallin family)
MRKIVLRTAAAACVAAACLSVCEGGVLAAVGYALMTGSLLMAAKYRRPKSVIAAEEKDDTVQFGWGYHESLRQVQK